MKAPRPTSSAAAPILVVDDEETVLATVQQTLWRAHYETVGASDPTGGYGGTPATPVLVVIAD